MKHRVTLVNPFDSHDGVIDSLTDNELVLTVREGFWREDRFTLDVSREAGGEHSDMILPPEISKLRIQWRKSDLSVKQKRSNQLDQLKQLSTTPHFLIGEQLFEPEGINIYVVPGEVLDSAEFLAKTSEYLNGLLNFNITLDQWVLTATSAMFATTDMDHVVYRKLTETLQETVKYLTLTLKKQFLPLIDSEALDLVVLEEAISIIAVSELGAETLTFQAADEIERQEIGLFLVDEAISLNDDIVVSGIRYVLELLNGNPNANKNNKLHKTLFHTKPKHRLVPCLYTIALKEPVGLHPTMLIKFNQTELPLPDSHDLSLEEGACKLFMYQSLPKDFFIDKYQLPKNTSLVALYGNSDLEAPAYVIDNWGTETLIELVSPPSDEFEFTIHSRYQKPLVEGSGSHFEAFIPTPRLFYACSVEIDPHVLEKSPFVVSGDNNVGGYQSYFTKDTAFYHFVDTLDTNVLDINIPIGSGDLQQVQLLTYVVVGLGVLWVFWKAFTNIPSKVKTE